MLAKIKALLALPHDLWLMVITHLPGAVGYGLRHRYWRRRLRALGPGTSIETGVVFENPGFISIGSGTCVDRNVLVIGGKPTTHGRRLIRQQPENRAEGAVTIGDGVHIAPFTILSGIGGLSIGNNCKIGSHVSIYTFSQVTARPNVLYLAAMRIGDDAVIGTNSSLICLTEVEAGTVVKPNSFLSETLLSKAGHAG